MSLIDLDLSNLEYLFWFFQRKQQQTFEFDTSKSMSYQGHISTEILSLIFHHLSHFDCKKLRFSVQSDNFYL